MTIETEMKRPFDSSKTFAHRPDQQSKSITHDAFVDLKEALEGALAFELRESRDAYDNVHYVPVLAA